VLGRGVLTGARESVPEALEDALEGGDVVWSADERRSRRPAHALAVAQVHLSQRVRERQLSIDAGV
jgi:hypothetical protein